MAVLMEVSSYLHIINQSGVILPIEAEHTFTFLLLNEKKFSMAMTEKSWYIYFLFQEAGLPSGHPSPGLTGQPCSGPGGLRQLHPEPVQADYEVDWPRMSNTPKITTNIKRLQSSYILLWQTAEQPPPSDQLWPPRHFPLWTPNKCSIQVNSNWSDVLQKM